MELNESEVKELKDAAWEDVYEGNKIYAPFPRTDSEDSTSNKDKKEANDRDGSGKATWYLGEVIKRHEIVEKSAKPVIKLTCKWESKDKKSQICSTETPLLKLKWWEGKVEYKYKVAKFWETEDDPKKARIVRKGLRRKILGYMEVDLLELKKHVHDLEEEKLNSTRAPSWNTLFDQYVDDLGIVKSQRSRSSNRGGVLKTVWNRYLKKFEERNLEDDGDGEEEGGKSRRNSSDQFNKFDLDYQDSVDLDEEFDFRDIVESFRDNVKKMVSISKKNRNIKPETRSVMQNLIEIVENLDRDDTDDRITILLGQTGMGKSTTINEALRMTEIVDPSHYDMLKNRLHQDERLSVYATLEPEESFLARIKEIKAQEEEQIEDCYKKIYGGLYQELPSFLLPQASNSDPCTPRAVEITFGAYALEVEYFTRNDIKQMLSDVDWQGCSLDSGDFRPSQEYLEYMEKILDLVQNGLSEEWIDEEEKTVEVDESVWDLDLDNERGDDSEEDSATEIADDKKQTSRAAVDNSDSDEYNDKIDEKKSLVYPKYKNIKSVVIKEDCEMLNSFWGRKVLYHGGDQGIDVERIWIREKMAKLLSSSNKSNYLIKRMAIKVPCLVAKANKILDVPGTDDNHPLHKAQLVKSLEVATNVVVLSSKKNMQGVSATVKDLLDEYVIPRWLKGDANLQLSILSCPHSGYFTNVPCETLVDEVDKKIGRWREWYSSFQMGSENYFRLKLKKHLSTKASKNNHFSKGFLSTNLRIDSCLLSLSSALNVSRWVLQKESEKQKDRNNFLTILKGQRFARGTQMLAMLWGKIDTREDKVIKELERHLKPYFRQHGQHFEVTFPTEEPEVDGDVIGGHVVNVARDFRKNSTKKIGRVIEDGIMRHKKLKDEDSKMSELFSRCRRDLLRSIEQDLLNQKVAPTLRKGVHKITHYIDALTRPTLRLLLDPNIEGRSGKFSIVSCLTPYVHEVVRMYGLRERLKQNFTERKKKFFEALQNAFKDEILLRFGGDESSPAAARLRTWLLKDFLPDSKLKEAYNRKMLQMESLLSKFHSKIFIQLALEKSVKLWLRDLAVGEYHSNNEKDMLNFEIISSFKLLTRERNVWKDNDSRPSFEKYLSVVLMRELSKIWRAQWKKTRGQIFYRRGTLYQWVLMLINKVAGRRKDGSKTKTFIKKFLKEIMREIQSKMRRFSKVERGLMKDKEEIQVQLNMLRNSRLKLSRGLTQTTHSDREIFIDKKVKEYFSMRRSEFVELVQNQRSKNDAASLNELFPERIRILREPAAELKQELSGATGELSREQSLIWALLTCREKSFRDENTKDQVSRMKALAGMIASAVVTFPGIRWKPWRPKKPTECAQFFFCFCDAEQSQEWKELEEKHKLWSNAQFIQTFCDVYSCNVGVIFCPRSASYFTHNSDNKTSASGYFLVWDGQKNRYMALTQAADIVRQNDECHTKTEMPPEGSGTSKRALKMLSSVQSNPPAKAHKRRRAMGKPDTRQKMKLPARKRTRKQPKRAASVVDLTMEG
eukprot:CAMPEP_0184485454 /NCGR_PEP_ID=MMETSP0113_2-20130426/7052_1 /TAXON_ID=91329 /ORGANISM="Norrisiella sphaerica, Strain BC52" /LENGTH=1517 /DNA_ID=CAMNT_0026866903 /DNA_START=175 /DNA_END=4724 /DNA_ORIENTATION=+